MSVVISLCDLTSMTALSWRADENGVALHMPDPTGHTNGGQR